MNVIYQVEGGESLAAVLEALPRAVARRVARRAIAQASGQMLAAIKAGIHSQTGLLAGGMRVRNARGDRPGRMAMLISSWASRATVAKKRPSLHVAAGRDQDRYQIYYGRFVEFGHKGRTHYEDAERPAGYVGEYHVIKPVSSAATPAHPFMRPGFDAAEEAVATAMEEALGEGIDQAFTQNQ